MGINNSDIKGFIETMNFLKKIDIRSYILAENKFIRQFNMDILLQNIDIALDNRDEELFIKLTKEMKLIEGDFKNV